MAFAMGAVGLASRFLSPLLGPPLGFAAFSDEAAAAPGQVALATMARVLGHLTGPPQRLFAVVGRDVSGSLSPLLHAAAFAHLGLPYLLVPISVPTVEELDAVIAPSPALLTGVELELAGWAVTTPYKADAVRLADQVSPRARRAGAANTVLCAGGRLLADTTDGDGVVAAAVGLGVDLASLTAVVRGTGGAGRGAAVGLAAAGARVVLQGRRLDHTRSVADALGVDAATPETEAPTGAVLVNATPLGRAADDPSPFTGDEVARARAVVDMVYARRVTPLVELAASRGVAVADGRDVLAGQGYPQLAAFTGRIPPREIMRRALDDAP
jgi:shikimate dehydrogenase